QATPTSAWHPATAPEIEPAKKISISGPLVVHRRGGFSRYFGKCGPLFPTNRNERGCGVFRY
ncbi:MAG: hypothetical protein WCF90_08625, partial [Methanomicrobiales archaeon]